MKIHVEPVTIAMATPFRISRGSRTECHVVRVTVEQSGISAQGECTPYPRYGESVESVIKAISQAAHELQGLFAKGDANIVSLREKLQTLLPAGAARNALDCAMWNLQAKLAGKQHAQDLFELPTSIVTAMTVSINTPEAMANQTRSYIEQGAKLLKVKLDGEQVIERVRAVREAAGDAMIVLDANEAWQELDLDATFAALTPLNIAMIEQPLPSNDDDKLKDISHPIPLCADESCHTRQQLHELVGKYEMVNIKLDKTGGLTEALLLAEEAKHLGFTLMSGCMLGTSLAMRAALPIAVQSKVVDLDGPILLGQDIEPALVYREGEIVL
ncbi:L-Ala-D/L-Glu epimerase [Vibrio harveyi]|uniref:N-acetyl-D-Glu racemase DgcA n=1 Tax=Vibrio harveyi TaxID=669 RepID=UPI001EFD72EA|nr:N-acetyl-D-Glu racemase DgcA [Vibrio harveyi]EKO3853653.1 L-Ala-D/L-Glu epimerase [Vibrio harveyi]MCG9608565.1 L-Ala-D/L-Glu epimerase [Vibrio harveyi]MCG9666569.1 L-Ala-D/L-Glu epimerase [Vibrio harveyi]